MIFPPHRDADKFKAYQFIWGKTHDFSYNFESSSNVCVLATTFSYLEVFKTLRTTTNNTLSTGLSAFLNQSLTR